MAAALPFIPAITSGIGLVSGLLGGNKAEQRNQQIQGQLDGLFGQQQGLFNQIGAYRPGMEALINQQQGALGGLMQDRESLGGLMGQMQTLLGRAGAFQPGAIGDGGAASALMGNANQVLASTDPSAYRAQAQFAGQDALRQMQSDMAQRGTGASGLASALGAQSLSRLYADASARGQQDRLQAAGLANGAYQAAGGLNLQASDLRNRAANDNLQLQAGLLGQQAGLTNQRAGLLGQYVGGLGNLLGQYGALQQGLMGQAGLLGQMYGQQAQGINPNPYGGFSQALGSFGNALGFGWQNRNNPGLGYNLTGGMGSAYNMRG